MSHAFVDRMMEQTRRGELRSPVSQTMDMHLVDFGRGKAVYEMAAREELGNPLGVIQGGVATVLADAAMAAATTTILTDEEIQKSAITTIDIFARFIRPVNAKRIQRLRAEAEVVRLVDVSSGRRPTCSPTVRWWASSHRPTYAYRLTRSPTSLQSGSDGGQPSVVTPKIEMRCSPTRRWPSVADAAQGGAVPDRGVWM